MYSRYRVKDRLKQARTAAGISQSELARRVIAVGHKDLRSTHISSFELGYRDATREDVEALASVLKVSAEWLLGRTDENSMPPPRFAEAAVLEKPVETPPGVETPPRVETRAPVETPAFVEKQDSVETPALVETPTVVETAASVETPEASSPPNPLDPPTSIPQRNGMAVSDYRRHLASELNLAENKLREPALTPLQWRGWRAYAQGLRAELVATR